MKPELRSPLIVEGVLLCFIALALLLYAALDLSLHDPLDFYFLQLRLLPLGYGVALLICLVCVFAADGYRNAYKASKIPESESLMRFVQLYLKPLRVQRDLRLLHAVIIAFVVFAHLKHLIPFLNSEVYDAPLMKLEQYLLGGLIGFQYLDTFIPRSGAHFIAAVYEGYYAYLTAIVFLFVFQRKDPFLAEEFCTAYILTWLGGVLIVYLFPTWGPIFFSPELMEGLPETSITPMQNDLWAWKEMIDVDPGRTDVFFAISGFPSLHLAVVLLGSYYLHFLHRSLAIASWCFAFLTFVATIYLGWHWIIDDLGSVVLVAAVVMIVRPTAQRLKRSRSAVVGRSNLS